MVEKFIAPNKLWELLEIEYTSFWSFGLDIYSLRQEEMGNSIWK